MLLALFGTAAASCGWPHHEALEIQDLPDLPPLHAPPFGRLGCRRSPSCMPR